MGIFMRVYSTSHVAVFCANCCFAKKTPICVSAVAKPSLICGKYIAKCQCYFTDSLIEWRKTAQTGLVLEEVHGYAWSVASHFLHWMTTIAPDALKRRPQRSE
jgi:hypothetical protein